jgi:hypothetical protein
VLVASSVAYNSYDIKEMSEQSFQIYLRLYGESIYEYHTLTGEWPSRVADLARTSLPLRNPHWWKVQLDIEADVIVWPKNLKPNPEENGRFVLAYHNKGLDAERGRIWVCWGDLRTGCITQEQLREILNEQKP